MKPCTSNYIIVLPCHLFRWWSLDFSHPLVARSLSLELEKNLKMQLYATIFPQAVLVVPAKPQGHNRSARSLTHSVVVSFSSLQEWLWLPRNCPRNSPTCLPLTLALWCSLKRCNHQRQKSQRKSQTHPRWCSPERCSVERHNPQCESQTHPK